MTISKKIEDIISKASFIRKMFEEGAQLKTQYGADNVYDFSLGNPNLPPPEKFNELLRDTVDSCGLGDHCYMPNTGYPMVCGSVADYLAEEQQAPVTDKEILMTCGASGALNVALKTILDPDDEVLTPAPCFVEYKFYADNHGGILKTVQSKSDFQLDAAFSTYIYSIARLLWLKHLRMVKKIEIDPLNRDMEDRIEFEEPSPVEDKDLRMAIYQRTLLKIPEDCQKILQLTARDLSSSEIAQQLGFRSEGYVRKRRHFCKEYLVNKIKDDPDYQAMFID